MPNAPSPLNYATDDPVEEVPRLPRSWVGAVGIGVLLAAAALAFVVLGTGW
jgi:hypothetical protein